MYPLNHEQLSQLIGKIYDAALEPHLWQQFMEAARNIFGSKGSTFLMLDYVQPQRSVVDIHGVDNDLEDEVLQRREKEDYWYLAARQYSAGNVVLGSKLIEPGVMRQTSFYNDIASPLDIEYMLGCVINNGKDRSAFISFLRGDKSDNFTEEHEYTLTILLPHIQKAYFIQQQLSEKASLEMALNESPYGVVILDTNKRPMTINKMAEQFFLEQDGMTLRYGSLKFWEYSNQVAFDHTVNRIIYPHVNTIQTHGETISICRPSGKMPYQLMITPLNHRSTEVALNDRGACIIFIHDPTITPNLSIDVLMTSYGLTKAEATLCDELFSGKTLEHACDSLHVSRNTAKTHLKQIFNKCGVNSQAALMRLLALGLKG